MEMYCNNMVDYHLIMDLIPSLARLYFQKFLGETHLSAVQAVRLKKVLYQVNFNTNVLQAIMLGVGLQFRTMDEIAKELDVPVSQILGLFNKTMRRLLSYLNGVMEQAVDAQLWSTSAKGNDSVVRPLEQTLQDELDEVAKVTY